LRRRKAAPILLDSRVHPVEARGRRTTPHGEKDGKKGTEARPFDGGVLTRKGNTRTGKGTGDGATSSIRSRHEVVISSRAC
jgi:hypothetical protein